VNRGYPCGALLCALFWLVAPGGCGGGSASEPAPTAALAGSRGAQEAFRPLKQRFVSSERTQRAVLEPNLKWFVAAYPKDGLSELAKVYLGLIAVDRGDLPRARDVARGIAAGKSGTTRDLVELLDGAILLRQNATTQALERFMALIGKLIDPYARMLLDEYIVLAAIGSRRWYEAVAYMDLWLREAPDDSATAARAQVRKDLEAIPGEALELMLQAMRAEAGRAGYGIEIRKAVVARLASIALEQQDTKLARRLVESPGTSQSLGDAAEGLEELASSGGAAAVDGRTIGLLVSSGAGELGGRAAEVVAGVVDALRSMADGASEHVRLTTRDDRETKRTELALLALAAQGASILIAGLDPPQAEVAASFAERTHTPVILLSALPGGRNPSPPAFVLGEASDRAALALIEALVAHGARSVAPVGGSPPQAGAGRLTLLAPAPCPAAPNQTGVLPVDAWRAAKVDHLLLLGDTACASEVLAAVANQKLGNVRAAIGLEAADIAAEPSRVSLLLATAGIFPLKRGDQSGPLSGFKKRQGRPPSFWAALGHDAAVLAQAAAKTLPLDRIEEASEVEARHQLATDALASVKVDLWSTAARGFAGRSTIARDIVVVEAR